jgi:hypothetical protein
MSRVLSADLISYSLSHALFRATEGWPLSSPQKSVRAGPAAALSPTSSSGFLISQHTRPRFVVTFAVVELVHCYSSAALLTTGSRSESFHLSSKQNWRSQLSPGNASTSGRAPPSTSLSPIVLQHAFVDPSAPSSSDRVLQRYLRAQQDQTRPAQRSLIPSCAVVRLRAIPVRRRSFPLRPCHERGSMIDDSRPASSLRERFPSIL